MLLCACSFFCILAKTEMRGIRMKRCLKIQIAGSGLLCMFLLGMQIRTGILSPVKSEIIISTLMISLVSLQLRAENKYFFNISQIVNVLFLPYDLEMAYLAFFQLLFKSFPQITNLIGILRIVGFAFVLVPVTVVSYGKLRYWLSRLINIEMVVFTFLIFDDYPLISHNLFLRNFEYSGLVCALSFIVFLYLVLKGWGLKLRINIKQKWTRIFTITTVGLVAFGIWYDFFAAFIQIADNFSEAIWNWNFSLLNPNQSLFFPGNPSLVYFATLNAGIFEELERYAILVVLAGALKNKKFRAQGMVLISALIFSLSHYSNMISEHKDFVTTSYQVMDVFTIGCLLAIIYSYTGKLWLAMIVHGVWDFLVFAMIPATMDIASFLDLYVPSGILVPVVINTVGIPIIIFMLSGKRLSHIEKNIHILLKSTKSVMVVNKIIPQN